MAYKPRKKPAQELTINESFLDQPEVVYPFNKFPFNVLDKEEQEQAQDMIELYNAVLTTKTIGQLNAFYDLGKSYPNYKNLIGVLVDYINMTNDDLAIEAKKVIIAIGFIQISK